MVKSFLFPTAKEHLRKIYHYTYRNYDEGQANCYQFGLLEATEKAAQTRQWRVFQASSGELIPFIHYEHHYVYFRELQDGRLGVIAILHERMDQIKRLKAFE